MKGFLRENIFVILTSVFLILLSITPDIYRFLKTPPGHTFTFHHNSLSDYSYYISFVRQGTEGKLLAMDRFTSEPQTPAFYHGTYLILGLLGRVFSFSPVYVYLTSRIILGSVFLFSGYLLIGFFIREKMYRILAFLIFSLSASFPNFIMKNGLVVEQFLPWWTEVDPVKRAAFIPHFLVGHIALALGIYFLIKSFSGSKKKFILSVVLGLVTGFAHPPSLGMLYYIFGSFALLLLLLGAVARNIKEKLPVILHIISFVLLTLPSIYFTYRTTSNIFPWTLMRYQEAQFYYISFFEFLLSLGPVLVTGIVGFFIIYLNRKSIKQPYFLPLFLWAAIDIAMVPFSKMLAFAPLPFDIPTFSNLRFLSMAVNLPLAISSVYFFRLFGKFGRKVFAASVILFFIINSIVLPFEFARSFSDFSNAPHFIYQPKSITDAYRFLSENDNGKSVLARHELSKVLPIFGKNTVFAGQQIYTYDNDNKEKQVKRFFEGMMGEKEASEFVMKGNMGYVLADGEKEIASASKFGFLKKVFASEDGRTVVYEVDM